MPKVGLFVSCLIDLNRPQVGFAAVELLQQSGCQVEVPAQTCCGQPAYNSGDNYKARKLAQQTITTFESYDYVVAPSGSCAATIKLHYPRLFDQDDDWLQRALSLATKTYELTTFLNTVMDFTPTHEVAATEYAYHDSCSGLRELGIRHQPRQLLAAVKGLTLRELDNAEVCCGFGGLFCIKYPEISTVMAERKVEGLIRSGVGLLTGGDLGCLLNMAGLISRRQLPIRVFHIAEILAYGLNPAAIGEVNAG